MPRHDGLSGISEGLGLAKAFLALEAESAFLTIGVAKDPYVPQKEVLNSFKKIKACFGANRCLRETSDILMADGTTETLINTQVGDMVMAYDFTLKAFVPARVSEVFHNPPMQILLFKHSQGVLECSARHKVAVIYPTGRTGWARVKRASFQQLPVIVRDKNGCPILSDLKFIGEMEIETTMDLCIDHPDHAFVANSIVVSNSGKTHGMAYSVAWDATGLYPDWYTGPKSNRGIDCWVMGDTGANTRDACQRKLFGTDPERPGWTDKPGIHALIPAKYIIGKPTRQSAPSGLFDTVRVKHVPSDTISTISFKSHQMDRQALAAWNGDLVWIDEEPPLDILMEMVARVMDNKGRILLSMCPLDGVTPTVKFLQQGPQDLIELRYLTHRDAKHLDETEKANIARLYASNPAMLLARTEGRATQNSGLIFPFSADKILYNPNRISISSRWKYLGGLDVGWRHPTAAAALAWDPMSDVVYCYATYEQTERPPLYHHAQLQSWGENMTFMIDPASNQVNQASGDKVLEEFWKCAHGPEFADLEEPRRKYIKADNCFQTGMGAMWNRFEEKRLLISQNLRSLIEQYESYGWDKDGKGPKTETPELRYDIITSLRYAVMGIHEHAHRLDEIPPWKESEDFDDPMDIHDWKPYRCGRDTM
jgi:phage terminase large subunit-like protein